MKNNRKTIQKCVAGLAIIAICALAATGICMSYNVIKKAAGEKEYSYFTTAEFQRKLFEESYAVAYGVMQKQEGMQQKQPSAIFLKEKETSSLADEERKMIEALFNESVLESSRALQGESNLKYYVSGKEGTDWNDEALSKAEENKKGYQLLLRYDFDEKGALTVTSEEGRKEIGFSNLSYLEWMYEGVSIKPIKNMSIVFAVPNELKVQDAIYYAANDKSVRTYAEAAVAAGGIALAAVLLVALLFPYSWASGFYMFRIPMEIWAVAAAFDVAVFGMTCMNVVGFSIIHDTAEIGTLVVEHKTIMLFNFLLWFGIFLVSFLGMLEIKSIFKLGIREYVAKRTLIGRFFISVKNGIGQAVDVVEQMDLRDNNTRYILKVLGINALLILLMLFLGKFGIIAIIVYTVILYVIIKNCVDKVSENYRILTEATNQIAEGNIETVIAEDLGVFEPFKENLEKIQGGFKKAVEEEVRSQKMKADLITNVSHDLKTPLTAIITYADLIQEETLSAEKRCEYAEVLGRKAQRLQVLIEDLFEMSKASSGTMTLNKEMVDVVSLMQQTLIEVESSFKEAFLAVKASYDADRILLNLDSERTYRVFENLLLNASKYAMKHTRVYVEVKEEEKQVEISIKNVSAIEMEFAPEEIVERFARGDKARNTEGSGLGLAIAKSFVELQGGTFTIEIDGDLFKAVIRFPK